MTIFNLFSKGFSGVTRTIQTSEIALLAKLVKGSRPLTVFAKSYCNLPLRSHDHTNIFASCFFSRNSCFLFVLLLTVFLVIKHNTYNGTKNSNALSFYVSVAKIWIVTRLHSVLILLGGDVELN